MAKDWEKKPHETESAKQADAKWFAERLAMLQKEMLETTAPRQLQYLRESANKALKFHAVVTTPEGQVPGYRDRDDD